MQETSGGWEAGRRTRNGSRQLTCAETGLQWRTSECILLFYYGPLLPQQPSIATKSCLGGVLAYAIKIVFLSLLVLAAAHLKT